MTASKYKGFKILAQPYQLHETKRWTADFEIRRNGRRQPFGLDEWYPTGGGGVPCAGLGRRIIDGRVPGWSVEHLRGETRGWSALLHESTGESMRQSLIAGIVLVCLGLFVLLRGASFTSKRDVLEVGEVKITADQKQSIPPWAGGAAVVVGAVLIVAGARKRA
jgi:hypothetical protein